MKNLLKFLFLGIFLCSVIGLTLTACEEADDCSLTGRPSPRFSFVDKGTPKDTAFDTLTVVALNTIQGDSVILNKLTGASYAALPLSYVNTKTAMIFEYSNGLRDTLWITHTNIEHFLSMDCGITMYHQIDKVEHTKIQIDSIVIINSRVDINEKENIRVYY